MSYKVKVWAGLFLVHCIQRQGFPGGATGQEPTCQCRGQKRCWFDPWVRKIPWRRAQKPTPVFLSGKFHGQRSLVDYSLQGHKRLVTTKMTKHASRGQRTCALYKQLSFKLIKFILEMFQMYTLYNGANGSNSPNTVYDLGLSGSIFIIKK